MSTERRTISSLLRKVIGEAGRSNPRALTAAALLAFALAALASCLWGRDTVSAILAGATYLVGSVIGLIVAATVCDLLRRRAIGARASRQTE